MTPEVASGAGDIIIQLSWGQWWAQSSPTMIGAAIGSVLAVIGAFSVARYQISRSAAVEADRVRLGQARRLYLDIGAQGHAAGVLANSVSKSAKTGNGLDILLRLASEARMVEALLLFPPTGKEPSILEHLNEKTQGMLSEYESSLAVLRAQMHYPELATEEERRSPGT